MQVLVVMLKSKFYHREWGNSFNQDCRRKLVSFLKSIENWKNYEMERNSLQKLNHHPVLDKFL